MSRLRVAGGEARGRRLKSPRNIRPTQGMVKQAIFNMAGPRIEGATVLDLFAGSGALGIEALSRGAARVIFVDLEPRGLAILRQNLDALGFKERALVVRGDVVRWLESSANTVASADFIFLDPPYGDVVLDRALKQLDGEVAGATVMAEHSRRQSLPALSRLVVDRERRYGDTVVTVLKA
ncbi:MAG TPA: 16S rRNA (guanine(966)-N(2))-methyltransferase RsmD [Candidatus Dormibacteraeota bacterium]|nr:16S rRNA (guanine(966)-N(2))-methyltransferase RsmD [Candidatus Dormibacteraeota bacterium]